MQSVSEKKKSLLKNKKADTVIVVIILLPVILLLTFYIAGWLGTRAVMERRIQNAIDIILLDVSETIGTTEVYIDGSYQLVCALNREGIEEKVNYYESQIVSKIDGFNNEWELNIDYVRDPEFSDYEIYTSVKVEIKASFPGGIISNYTNWYKKNTFSSSSTTAINTKLFGIASCR